MNLFEHGFAPPAPGKAATFRTLGRDQLRRLWSGSLGVPCPAHVLELFDELVAGWGDLRPGRPVWPSDITDDHSPFELSLAVGGATTPELRILVEAQAAEPTLSATMRAGRALNERLGSAGAALRRFRLVEDIFLPPEPTGRFALWHSVAITPGEPVAYKAYLNPQIRGAAAAGSVLAEALDRLGLPEAAATVARLRAEHPRLEPRYFGLDLSTDERARVKIYFYHHGGGIDEIAALAREGAAHPPGLVERFCAEIAGQEGPYHAHPPATCLAFVAGADRPTATIHVPVRFYVANDAQARGRITAALERLAIDPSAYLEAVAALAGPDLAHRRGVQTYASLRLARSGSRATVYLAPQVYSANIPEPGAMM